MALPTIYVDTGGATTNSGSSDNNAADLDSAGTGTTVSVSGGTVTFSGAVDLSAVPTDGSATIYIADATNSNQKIFKITAVNDAADTVTVTPNPSGVIATSAWAIGGRFLASAGSLDANLGAALAAGWSLCFNNSPASHSGSDFIVPRNNGAGGTAGRIKVYGKTGALRTLTVSDTNQVVQDNATARQFWIFENLEFVQQGASGAAFQIGTAGSVCNKVNACKCSDAGGSGFAIVGTTIINSEATGAGSVGVVGAVTSASNFVLGNYIHDNGTHGIQIGGNTGFTFIAGNIIDTNAGRGIYNAQSTTGVEVVIIGNTLYGQGDSGIEFSDIDTSATIYNNLLLDNGNAGTEFNVEMQSGQEDTIAHNFNCFSIAGGAGGGNLSNLTAASSEITTDPQLIDAANGDFRLGASSGCRQTGWPASWLGLGIAGYPDIGAVQAQATAAAAGGSFTWAG